ncbi:MAG: hypothetical protein KIT33_12230 [Candidatus Kapabacteria bacterium]|nr:hypothetical protein [Ignavibacteriota bacterium]MCW5885728.1 hypothetical protein [Candidatus Kapabacteria bacterium]
MLNVLELKVKKSYQLLFEQDFNVKKGINDLILNLNDFKTGMYLIRYSSGGSYQSVYKLIIVK